VILPRPFETLCLLCQIPNPLFDLAGVTCGHFLVPFWKFFGATFVGKAIFKVHIQVLFVVTLFNIHYLEWCVHAIESAIPFLTDKIHPFVEKEKAKLHRVGGVAAQTAGKGMLGHLWDSILIVMIGYFIYSIVLEWARGHLAKEQQRQIDRLLKKNKSQ